MAAGCHWLMVASLLSVRGRKCDRVDDSFPINITAGPQFLKKLSGQVYVEFRPPLLLISITFSLHLLRHFFFFSYLFVLNIWRLISVHCCHLHSPSFLPISLLKLKLNVVEYNFLKKTYPLSCLIRKCPFHAMVDSAEHFVVSCRCLSFKNVSIQMVNG